MSEYVLLWLEAPLQSWGYDSKFDRRDTGSFPTRSGVMGLLFSAMGLGGEQESALAEWAEVDMIVESFRLTNAKGKLLPNPGMLRDFHTVGTHYNDQDPWEKLMIPKTSEGKNSVGGGAKVTFRNYLQDAAFAVVMELPSGWRERVVDGLQRPVWDISLGRRNCTPTEFVYQGIFESPEQALVAAQEIAQQKRRVSVFRVLNGAHKEAGEVRTLNDVPIRFGSHKLYRDRRVTVVQ